MRLVGCGRNGIEYPLWCWVVANTCNTRYGAAWWPIRAIPAVVVRGGQHVQYPLWWCVQWPTPAIFAISGDLFYIQISSLFNNDDKQAQPPDTMTRMLWNDLTDRTAIIRIGGYFWQTFGLFSGVPQGGSLSPTYSISTLTTWLDRLETQTTLHMLMISPKLFQTDQNQQPDDHCRQLEQ